MSCCRLCSRVISRSYLLCGDGDGVEFLVETSHLDDEEEIVTTVQLSLL